MLKKFNALLLAGAVLLTLCACGLFDLPDPYEPDGTTPVTASAPTTTIEPPPTTERVPLAADAFPFAVPEELRTAMNKTLLENHGAKVAADPMGYRSATGGGSIWLNYGEFSEAYGDFEPSDGEFAPPTEVIVAYSWEVLSAIPPQTKPSRISAPVSMLFPGKAEITKEELQAICGNALEITFNHHDGAYEGNISSLDKNYHVTFYIGETGNEPVANFELCYYAEQEESTAPPATERKPLPADAFPFAIPKEIRELLMKTYLENHGNEALTDLGIGVYVGKTSRVSYNDKYTIFYDQAKAGPLSDFLPLSIGGAIDILFPGKSQISKEELQAICGEDIIFSEKDPDINKFFAIISEFDYTVVFHMGESGKFADYFHISPSD